MLCRISITFCKMSKKKVIYVISKFAKFTYCNCNRLEKCEIPFFSRNRKFCIDVTPKVYYRICQIQFTIVMGLRKCEFPLFLKKTEIFNDVVAKVFSNFAEMGIFTHLRWLSQQFKVILCTTLT